MEMTTYILTPDAAVVALACFFGITSLFALATRLIDDLRSVKRKDNAETKKNLANAKAWDEATGIKKVILRR